jgi:hypothetical protein
MEISRVTGRLEKADQSEKRLTYYEQLEELFLTSPRTVLEKLIDFPNFVPNNSVARFLARYELFKLCLDVQGTVIECGVLGGAGITTFAHLSTVLEPYNQTRTIIGFDTFEGFPHISDHDRQGSSEHMHVGAYAEDTHEELLKCTNIHNGFRLLSREPQVELIKGDICSTVPQYLADNPALVVSMLYLDCDLYAPTKTALECFVPHMPRGAVIVFDELGFREFPGETIALTETLGINRLKIRRLPFTKISYAVID